MIEYRAVAADNGDLNPDVYGWRADEARARRDADVLRVALPPYDRIWLERREVSDPEPHAVIHGGASQDNHEPHTAPDAQEG